MATATPLLLCCILSKFYIKPQRTGNRPREAAGCILSKFYIKPQRLRLRYRRVFCCILSKFYIKPQQSFKCFIAERRCILSKFYIKPQPCNDLSFVFRVVSYRNSTSNHNINHIIHRNFELYLIEILHQTTTNSDRNSSNGKLYLIEILHQTTTVCHSHFLNF